MLMNSCHLYGLSVASMPSVCGFLLCALWYSLYTLPLLSSLPLPFFAPMKSLFCECSVLPCAVPASLIENIFLDSFFQASTFWG